MTGEDKRGPGLRFPPPLLPLGIIGGAWLLNGIFPLPILSEGHPWRAGVAVVVLAFGLALAAALQFLAAKTHIEPWRPASRMIRHGLFAFSRNPIYLAFCVATLGAGLLLNSWWAILGTPLLAWLLLRFVIRREERYLEDRFGEEYRAYMRSVRRWF